MKTNLSAYGYENFKPNFDNVSVKDLLTKPPFDVPDSLVGYILPKEFAARLSLKMGFDVIVFPFRDVPLTNRNILESHIFTKCVLLQDSIATYNQLLPIYNSIKVWGETSEQPASYAGFNRFIRKEYLDLFKDRIRFIPPNEWDDLTTDTHGVLKACGVSQKDLFKNIIDFINTTVDFKYKHNVVNFLKTYVSVKFTPRGLEFVNGGGHVRNISGFGPTSTDPYKIARFLYSIYFSQYTQWADDSTWVEVGGDKIYVDHHSVYEVGKFDTYLRENKTYRNRLPFGIHPAEYFKERIEKLAVETHSEAMNISYPVGFKGYVDLTHSPHRQLVTGLDLVNEGVYMKHCVGGRNYQEQIVDGEALFFHLQVPGDKHGATLSMERSRSHRGSFRLNGEWWAIDQYYGFDDRYARDGESEEVLQEFLKEHFTPYSSKLITKIHAAPQRQLRDYVYRADWELKLYEKVSSNVATAWKNAIGTPKDYSLDATLERLRSEGRAGDDGIGSPHPYTTTLNELRSRHAYAHDVPLGVAFTNETPPWNFGSMQYSPELIRRLQTFEEVDASEAFYPTIQPTAIDHFHRTREAPTLTYLAPSSRGGVYDLYGTAGLFADCRVLEPDQGSFEISVTRYPTTKYGYHENTLRPIKLIDEIERTITLIVNGITIANGTNAHPVVLPPGATLQVVTRNATTRVNLAVTVDTYASKPEIRREVLSQNATYTNTTRHPQAVVAYLVTEIAPAKIPLLINNLFYPPKSVSIKHDIYNRGRPTSRGSIIYPNYQTMGRIFRS